MPLDVARSLSISDLLCVLNEKLRLECNGLREYHPPPALSTTSLETEVSAPESAHLNDRGFEISYTDRNPPDQKSRNQSTSPSESHSLVAEPVAADQ